MKVIRFRKACHRRRGYDVVQIRLRAACVGFLEDLLRVRMTMYRLVDQLNITKKTLVTLPSKLDAFETHLNIFQIKTN